MRSPGELKRILLERAMTVEYELSPGAKGAIVGTLNRVCGSDQERHAVLDWLFSKKTTRALTEGEWCALDFWVGSHQDEQGRWVTQPDLPGEVVAWRRGEGQLDIFEFD